MGWHTPEKMPRGALWMGLFYSFLVSPYGLQDVTQEYPACRKKPFFKYYSFFISNQATQKDFSTGKIACSAISYGILEPLPVMCDSVRAIDWLIELIGCVID
jgi:hypothetical protein